MRVARPTTFVGHLVRSLASVSLVFALLGGVLVVGADEPTAGPAPGASRVDVPPVPPLWETDYSERYPGCVSLVLWPLDEVPVALVTRSRTGAVSRVPLDEVDRAPLSPVGRAHAIGACRQ